MRKKKNVEHIFQTPFHYFYYITKNIAILLDVDMYERHSFYWQNLVFRETKRWCGTPTDSDNGIFLTSLPVTRFCFSAV